MGLKSLHYFVFNYRPLIIGYAGGPGTQIDIDRIKRAGRKPVVLQFLSWWAGSDRAMGRCRDVQRWLGNHGIEHHLMVNAEDEDALRRTFGVRGAWCSKNLFCDESIFRPGDEAKRFDAVYIAQIAAYKRLHLAQAIDPLLIVKYSGDINAFCPELSHAVSNPMWLTQRQVASCIRLSRCGLCLSETEGQNNATVEYLLCGVPVVSTPSRGGRDIYYDDANSLIVPPDAGAVAEAVEWFKSHPPDGQVIRTSTLQRIRHWRRVLCDYLEEITARHDRPDLTSGDFSRRIFDGVKAIGARTVRREVIDDHRHTADFAFEDLNSRVRLNPGVSIQHDGDALLVKGDDQEMLRLGGTAIPILAACDRGGPIGSVLEELTRHYPGQREDIEADVRQSLHRLYSRGVIGVD